MSKPIPLQHPTPARPEKCSEGSEKDLPFFGACSKCSHRLTCKKPCFFVEEYLKFENRKPFERNFDEFMTVIFPGSKKEVRECDLSTYEDGKPAKENEAFFSTENESAFKSASEPKLKQTGIFIDRFFFQMGYDELSEKYDTSLRSVMALYTNAKKRIVKTVEAMDRVDLAKNNGAPVMKTKRAVQAFLLHAAFELSVSEISRLMGVSHTLIIRYLNTTKDRLMTGEISLFDYTDADREAAQERLEAARTKRQAYDKKRVRPPRRKKS